MDVSGLSVKAKTKITKFAEGANPETDKPFEVVEGEFTLYGKEAAKLLESQGVDVEAYMAEQIKQSEKEGN